MRDRYSPISKNGISPLSGINYHASLNVHNSGHLDMDDLARFYTDTPDVRSYPI